MQYIWEAFLDGKNQDTYLSQAEIVSPYYECGSKKDINDNQIKYNSFVRFSKIFAPLFSINNKWILNRVLFDVISHYLIQVDIKKGYSMKEYKSKLLYAMLLDGYYGDNIKERYKLLSKEERYIITNYLQLIEENYSSMILFSKVAIHLLQTGVIYRYSGNDEIYILYMGKAKNESDLNKINLLKDLFLPFGFTLRVMWKHHFGIWDKENTLRYGKIELL